MDRQLYGKCIVKETWIHYPFIKGVRSEIPDGMFLSGEIYEFEYKPDKNGCWLYHLYSRNREDLCNWAFFDRYFEIIDD